jgi:hypothetical protein
MSKHSADNETSKPLLFLHFLGSIALGIAWAAYCWTNYRAPGPRRGRPGSAFESALADGVDYLASIGGDFLLGILTVVLSAVGTRVYLRRLQVWLDARSAGHAVAYGSADLKDQALAANAKAKG